jgi:hypothetical protein
MTKDKPWLLESCSHGIEEDVVQRNAFISAADRDLVWLADEARGSRTDTAGRSTQIRTFADNHDRRFLHSAVRLRGAF